MMHIHPKRSLVLLLVLAVQGMLLYAFFVSRDALLNLRPAYVTKIYMPAYRYAASVALRGLYAPTLEGGRTPAAQALSVPVLLYHGIIEEPDGANVLLDDFREQMFALKRAGYQAVGIDELYGFLKGERTLPERSFVVTFDDGRKDSYYPADPILAALDWRAVMFAISQYSLLEKSAGYYLSRGEIGRMAASGRWEVQSHGNDAHVQISVDAAGTKGYFYDDRKWLTELGRLEIPEEFKERIAGDLASSKRDLEELLGKPVTGFAFPFGEFGKKSQNFPEAGDIVSATAPAVYPLLFFQFAPGERFTANYAEPLSEGASPAAHFFVKRVNVEPDWTPDDLLSVLENGMAKTLPYADDFSSDHGWLSTKWGVVEVDPTKQLVLRARPDTSGSAVILDGTRHWTDYEVEAPIRWLSGSNIYLWSRYRNDGNYAACNFGNGLAHVEQALQGKTTVIMGVPYVWPFARGEPVRVGMRVSGRTVECLVGGAVVVRSDFLDPALSRGGIGFKTWDARLGAAEFTVEELAVTSI